MCVCVCACVRVCVCVCLSRVCFSVRVLHVCVRVCVCTHVCTHGGDIRAILSEKTREIELRGSS